VIVATHLLVYSDDPVATRAFFRDVLEWPFAEDEATAAGWLIFKTGPSELGVHPTNTTYEGVTYSNPRQHTISLMCDDLEKTKADLEQKGATFAGAIEDQPWGRIIQMNVPAADPIVVYEPRHPIAYDL
jgi:predicted enzyme related to lactoylglutathione lyase